MAGSRFNIAVIKTKLLYSSVCSFRLCGNVLTRIRTQSLQYKIWQRYVKIVSFSIDDNDGNENVTFKMNSRIFKLCCVYSNSLKISNVERESKIRRPLFNSSIKRKMRHFHVVVVE